MNSKKLDEDVLKEARFWEDFDIEAMKYGMPYWVDYQNAQYLNTPKRFLWSDPEIDKILYGDVKRRLLNSLPAESKVLDIGCGGGWLSLELARRGHHVVGIDIAEKRIEIAIDTAKKNNQEIDYRVCSLEDLGPDECFDVIVSFGTIHHFPNIEEELERVKALLKDDGLFIIVENCSNLFRNFADWFRKAILKRDNSSRSPFEDAASHKVVSEVRERFNVNKESFSLAFTKISAEVIDLLPFDLPRGVHYSLLRLIKIIDNGCTALKLFRGETVFMWCSK
ncbi:MAG: class I SAM-dependent methyltransferase [Proteobacteria bacterium]|nr:class I SAM-dependent methyltransferase [Pseudomonadota bacterium]